MKKLITTAWIATGLFITGSACAQAKTFEDFKKMSFQQKTKMVTDSLAKALTLTPAEYSKVYAAVFQGTQKAAPIQSSNNSRMNKGQKMKALLADEEAQLKSIITPQQYTLYQAKKQKLIAYYRSNWQSQKIVFNLTD